MTYPTYVDICDCHPDWAWHRNQGWLCSMIFTFWTAWVTALPIPSHATQKNKQTKKSGCFMLFHLFISFNRCAPGQSAKAPACQETDEAQRCSSANGRLCIPGSLGCWEVCRGGGDQGEGRPGNDVSTKVHGIKSKNTHAHTHMIIYIYIHI